MNEIIRRIQEVFLPEYFNVVKIYDLGDKYLFFIVGKDSKDKDDILDPWYTVDKKTKKIAGFVVHENLPLFKKAMQTEPVYTE